MRFLAFTLALALTFIVLFKTISPTFKTRQATLNNATIIKPKTALKPFKLLDTKNHSFTEKNLRGFWTVLFFGYMGCPGVCPATLNIMQQTFQEFADGKAPVKFVFVNINQEIPKLADLSSYIKDYNENFIAVVGNNEELAKLTNQLGIFANKEAEGIINHTSSLMLINPNGQLTAVISPPFNSKELASDLKVLTKS